MRRLHLRPVFWLIICVACGSLAGRLMQVLQPPRAVVAAGVTLPLNNELDFYTALSHLEQRVLGTPVRLRTENTAWSVVGLSLGVRLDRPAMWEDAVGKRKGETALAYIWRRFTMSAHQPRSVDIRLTYDRARVDEFLGKLGAEYWRPPKNARINTQGVVEPEATGRSLNVQATRKSLLDAWRQGLPTVTATIRDVQPATTTAMLRSIGVRYTLTQFSSYFDSTKTGRVENIRTAALLLDGTVVQPGKEFSFNTTVGPRTLERGFKAAEEIVNQELVPGIGGGVCQVSSTLYNAVLLSGLKVVQRQNHSKPLGYVPIGRDATVYYGAIDFRFRNSYTFPIVLAAEVDGNRLSVAVHAPRKPGVLFDLEVTDVAEIPFHEQIVHNAVVPPGQALVVRQGAPGWQVRTWRVTKSGNGTPVSREEISHDVYPAQSAVVQVNPGEYRPGEDESLVSTGETAPSRVGPAPSKPVPIPLVPAPTQPRPQENLGDVLSLNLNM